MKKIGLMKIRRQIVILLVLALTLSMVQGCGKKDSSASSNSPTVAAGSDSSAPTTSADQNNTPLDVKIGVNQSSYGWPFYVARDAGIFKKYNINVTIDAYASGGETLDALALKNEDVGEAADYAFTTRLAAGSNIRLVAYFGQSKGDASNLYVNDEDIKSVKDLVGKRIGVKKGTVNEYQWAILFQKAGVDESKVKQVALSSDAELITAYANDQIDALWSSGSNLQKLQSLVTDPNKLRSIGTSDQLTGLTTKTFVAFSNDFINKNKEGAERFLKAYAEAVDYFTSNPEESYKIIEKDVTLDEDTVKQEFASFDWTVQFKQEEYDYLKGVAKWAIDNKTAPGAYNIADYINIDLLKDVYPDRVDVVLN